MDYFTKRKQLEFLTATVTSKNKNKMTFEYCEETPRSYQKFNSFINGMDWIKATATISTTTNIALKHGEMITLENGLVLKVISVTPIINKRQAMYCKNSTAKYIINLE